MRRLLIAAVLTTFALPLAAQATHPDFTGNWVLDPKTSDLGMMASAQAMTMHVSQKDSSMRVERTASMGGADQSNVMMFNLGASPAKNSVSAQGQSIDMSTTTAWEGTTLVLTTQASAAGQALQQTDRWALDPDGKTLHIDSNVGVAGQSMSMKLTFSKQP
jgi:hypothetical protein